MLLYQQEGERSRKEQRREESRQEKGEEWRGGRREDTNRQKRGQERGVLGLILLQNDQIRIRWVPGQPLVGAFLVLILVHMRNICELL